MPWAGFSPAQEGSGIPTRPLPTALVLVALTLALCLTFEKRGRVPFTSDQAVVAIMAQDILERGAHPVFYYGAEYAGTLEPHYLALVFAVFGASPLAFRAAMAVLVAAAVLAAWLTGREAFGDRAGYFAGLYLALGPSFFLYKGLTSDGAYASLLVLSSLSLWLMLVVEGRFRESRPARTPLLGLGLVLGLAWWVHTPSAFLGAVGLAAVLAGSTRQWLSLRTLGTLVASFFVGSSPWWIRNFETGMGSLKSTEMAAAHTTRFASQVGALFLPGWNILLGGRSVWSLQPSFPGAGVTAMAVLALLLGFGFWSAARGASRPARYGAILCLTAMVALSALCLMVARTDFGEPRYLFAGYAGVAPLVGGLLDAVRPRRMALVALVAALLGLNLGSQVGAPVMNQSDPSRPFAGEYDLGPILDRLRADGVRSVYTSYWIAYRLTFLARGEVVASPLGRGPSGAVRIPAIKTAVESDPEPAFLLHGDDRDDMRAFLTAHAIVPRRRVVFPGFALFRGLPEEALRVLKRCNCIPTIVAPGEVGVLSAEGPERVAARGVARFLVTVRNDSPRPLSDNVHLGSHWIRGDGTVAQWDGERAHTGGWPRGTLTTELRVPVTVPPGEYAIVFDLVDENVAWFEWLGASTARRRVVVEPER